MVAREKPREDKLLEKSMISFDDTGWSQKTDTVWKGMRKENQNTAKCCPMGEANKPTRHIQNSDKNRDFTDVCLVSEDNKYRKSKQCKYIVSISKK